MVFHLNEVMELSKIKRTSFIGGYFYPIYIAVGNSRGKQRIHVFLYSYVFPGIPRYSFVFPRIPAHMCMHFFECRSLRYRLKVKGLKLNRRN